MWSHIWIDVPMDRSTRIGEWHRHLDKAGIFLPGKKQAERQAPIIGLSRVCCGNGRSAAWLPFPTARIFSPQEVEITLCARMEPEQTKRPIDGRTK